MLSLKEAKSRMKSYGFSSILTLQNANAKLSKSIGYYNAGISLAPASTSGYNLCVGATKQCKAACIAFTGRAEYLPLIHKSRINRAKLYIEDRKTFWELLEPELHMVDRKAKKLGVEVAFRPNIFSDQNWYKTLPNLFSTFPHWNFYSYTKVRGKVRQYMNGDLPDNYHVTYSWSERAKPDEVKSYLKEGINVAVPFYDKVEMKGVIPSEWNGYQVIDGDESDLRFLDPKGVIVGLKVKLPKSKAKALKRIKKSNGFFVGV